MATSVRMPIAFEGLFNLAFTGAQRAETERDVEATLAPPSGH